MSESKNPTIATEGDSTHGKKAGHLTARLVSNATFYGFGNILLKLGAFLVLPLYWHRLTPADFGLIALSQIITQFLASILDMGISGTIQRHYFEWPAEERPKYLGSIFIFSFLFSTFVSVILWFSAEPLVSVFGGEYSVALIRFGIAIAYCQNLGILPFSIYRSLERLRSFTVLTMGQFLSQTAAILFFIYSLNLGYEGFLWGSLVGSTIYSLLSLRVIFREVTFIFAWRYLRGPLGYAVPTLPAAVLESFGNVMDRMFLQNFVSMTDLGLYSVGRQFGMAYNFVVSSLKSSWIPLVYRMSSEREDSGKILGQMSIYYFFILSVFAVYAAMFSGDVMVILKKPEYAAVSSYAPFFVLNYFLFGVGNIFGRGLDLAKKTQYYWIVYAANLGSNIFFLKLWTPQYGLWGAIAAMMISGLIREGVLILLAHWAYPRPVEFSKIFKTILFFSLSYFGSSALNSLIGQEQIFWLFLVKSFYAVTILFLGIGWVFGKPGLEKAKEMVFRKIHKFIPRNK